VEKESRRYFFGLGRTLHGGVTAELFHFIRWLVAGVEGSPHRAGRNCVDSYALVDH
jgi:hypothetical protein